MLTWWQTTESQGALVAALGHANEAHDIGGRSATNKCELYFKSLNGLWNAFGHHQGLERGDTTLFIRLLQSLPAERTTELLRSAQVANVTNLGPLVMDHAVLNRRRYRPGTEMPGSLQREATAKHAELIERHAESSPGHSDSGRVLKTLAEFLYVVRSNIAHGEKTPYGPDIEKSRRDEQVASAVVPLQELLLDELLERPSEKLVAYGTLKPGEANAAIVAGLGGQWLDCTIRGHQIIGTSRFHEFVWDVRGEPVPAKLLVATPLRDEWERLDRFEGPGYVRHLVAAAVQSGNVVANCYVVRR